MLNPTEYTYQYPKALMMTSFNPNLSIIIVFNAKIILIKYFLPFYLFYIYMCVLSFTDRLFRCIRTL